jgi:hypothetical protein
MLILLDPTPLGERLESWWNFCTQRCDPLRREEIQPVTETLPCRPPLSPEHEANAKVLAQAIREATTAEIDERARTLVGTDDAHLFGENEFKVRELAHKIAAKAFEQHLGQKKRLPRRQRDLPPL